MTDGAKIFIFNPSLNKYLFMLRDNKPGLADANCWGLIGGAIETEEDPLIAVQREIAEEIGIKINNFRIICSAQVCHTIGDTNHIVQGYFYWGKTTVTDLEAIKQNEGQNLKYFSINEISVQPNISACVKTVLANYYDLLENAAETLSST